MRGRASWEWSRPTPTAIGPATRRRASLPRAASWSIGSHVLKSYSKQQRTVALSSAEAELHGIVAASSGTLGLICLLRDMGQEFQGEINCDSSAALGIAQRQGVGKLRHVRTQALWVQEVRHEGRLSYKRC